MKCLATTKVTGGKLLRVKCEVEDGVLKTVSITGDFFMHPEDGIGELEKCLVGVSVTEEMSEKWREECAEKLNAVIGDKDFELIGFGASDVAQTLVDALKSKTDAN